MKENCTGFKSLTGVLCFQKVFVKNCSIIVLIVLVTGVVNWLASADTYPFDDVGGVTLQYTLLLIPTMQLSIARLLHICTWLSKART